MMRLLLPHTTVLSACLDALRPAKPVVYNFTLAVAGYSGEISCDRPPNGWEILRSLVSGSMWKNGGGTPCAKLSCSCGHDSGVSHRGIGSGVGGVSERTMEMCSEIPCVCSTRGTTATKPLGFASGSILPTAEASGIGRSLSNDAIGVDEGIDGSSVDGFEGGEGGRRDMWRICQDVHVRIKRYARMYIQEERLSFLYAFMLERWPDYGLLVQGGFTCGSWPMVEQNDSRQSGHERLCPHGLAIDGISRGGVIIDEAHISRVHSCDALCSSALLFCTWSVCQVQPRGSYE